MYGFSEEIDVEALRKIETSSYIVLVCRSNNECVHGAMSAGVGITKTDGYMKSSGRFGSSGRHESLGRILWLARSSRLALQLSFCFEVRTLSDRLVGSAP
jgi:hypothetical protein